MKFFIENQEVDRQVESVIKKVRLRMNGETSHQMKQRGIVYGTNYGTGIPHLKEIAEQLPSDFDLAERLWYREIRETMILAAMIVPLEEMTQARCREWVSLITNMDLVERTTPFLFGQLPQASVFAKEWINSQQPWLVHLGCFTLGWNIQYSEAYTARDLDDFLNLVAAWKGDSMEAYAKSISFTIRKFVRLIKGSTPVLDQFLHKLMNSDLKPLLIMSEEIRTELEFVSDL